MRPHLLLAALLLGLAPRPAAADPAELMPKRLKAWLEPYTSSTRQLDIIVRSGDAVVTWTAGQARATSDGANWALTVLLAPADVRGTALLVREQAGQPTQEWLYLSSLRRVRQVQPVDEFAAFLGTEVTHADLGFVNLEDRSVGALGPETVDGVTAIRIQEKPKDKSTVSRIVTVMGPASGQPFKREFYDPADRLWKVQTFEDVADIHGVPTAQRVRIEDVQSGFGSEIRASKIAYGVPLPKELFDPARLPQAVDAAVWK